MSNTYWKWAEKIEEVCLALCHFAIAGGLAVGFASVGPGPSCRNCSETARDRERNRVLINIPF